MIFYKSSCTVFLILCSVQVVLADTITLPRAANNTIYIADASKLLPPGSVVQLEGDYLYVKIFNVQGTANNPVIFVNKGLVRIGGFKSYTFQIEGKHFVINGSGDPAHKYGFLLNYDTSVVGSFGFCPDNSSNFEVHHIECMNASSGILQNPRSGRPMYNVFYHHIYIHGLKNPNSSPPGRAEAFYMGNTSDTIPYNATYRFHNCRIEDCYMANLTGDGIQIGQGSFIVKRDTVFNYATAQIAEQNNGIQIGSNTSAMLDSVVVNIGGGKGLSVFGTDSVVVTNCSFSNIYVQSLGTEDIIYCNGKGPVPLNMRFQNNIISSCSGRYGIDNATSNTYTNGSVFINNSINGTFSKPYVINTTKDQWSITSMTANDYKPSINSF